MPPSSDRPDRYAVVGHPVEHSRSPLIHQLFAQQTGENLVYELIDALPEQFETAVLGFSAAGGRGLNITVPHKEAAFALCKIHGEEAQLARAVNTISFTRAGIRGDNTDGIGFIRDLTVNQNCAVAGKRVLLLGAGGAARGLIHPLIKEQPAVLVLANRTPQRALLLQEELGSPDKLSVLSFEDLAEAGAYDIIINATSAGLKSERPPFPDSIVMPDSFCYDLVYSLRRTPFVGWAEGNGARKAVQGWGMLVEQAAESFAIWRGKHPDTRPILEHLLRLSA